MLRPSPYRDETKTIKPITNEAFIASSGDIITDYIDLDCHLTCGGVFECAVLGGRGRVLTLIKNISLVLRL